MKGSVVGSEGMEVSHLQFADDTTLLDTWTRITVKCVTFYFASCFLSAFRVFVLILRAKYTLAVISV